VLEEVSWSFEAEGIDEANLIKGQHLSDHLTTIIHGHSHPVVDLNRISTLPGYEIHAPSLIIERNALSRGLQDYQHVSKSESMGYCIVLTSELRKC
jgi:hypothetical protein